MGGIEVALVRVLGWGREVDASSATGSGSGADTGSFETSTILALAAASFVCKFCTLRVSDSTLVLSFLLSFNILSEFSCQ